VAIRVLQAIRALAASFLSGFTVFLPFQWLF